MKKILTHLVGIVFLISILAAVGCSPAKVPPARDDLSVVHIYVKAVKIGEENHLELYDSNDTTKSVIDDLVTDVTDNTQVFWVLAESSGLKKIVRIRPKKADGKIIPRNAKGIWLFTRYKKHIVPDKQTSNDKNRYYIKVKDAKGKKWEIDPYLRIRGTDSSMPTRP